MVIFRIIFNLFGIVTRLGFGLLAFPVFLLTRHAFLLVIAAGILFIYLFMSSDDQQTRSTQNHNKPTMVRNEKGQMVQVTTPVARVEDGNSAFANDVYKQMTEQEQAYYSQMFFWVMGNVADGQTHSWSNVDIAGSIRPDKTFTNKTGEKCRYFGEVLKVHAVQQNITGLSCQNGTSWCKLRVNATPACGLGHKPGAWDSISGSLDKLF